MQQPKGVAIPAAWLTWRHLAASRGHHAEWMLLSPRRRFTRDAGGVCWVVGGNGRKSKVRAAARTPLLFSYARFPESRLTAALMWPTAFAEASAIQEGHTIDESRRRRDVDRRPIGPGDCCCRKEPVGSLLKTGRSRASRLAKPDARHHGSRFAADPAHKPASSVDAVRVPHRRRESAGG